MGPIAVTSRGNKHILVVTDHFTKWCEAFPTKDQKASTVAQTLISKVFSRFGPPTILHSDQGANFETTLMHEICDIMGIAKTRTTAYHPQGDGQVERHNRTIQDMLAAFVSAQCDDWDLWLDPIVYAYNTSRQESTGLSPYELVFGKLPRLPLECELGVPLSNPATHAEYTWKTRSILQQAQTIAQENLRLIRSKRCQADRQTEWQPYATGQYVWLRRPKAWKFGPKWLGPWLVLARLGVNYRIESDKGRVLVVHHDHLKPYFMPTGLGKIVCPGQETAEYNTVPGRLSSPMVLLLNWT